MPDTTVILSADSLVTLREGNELVLEDVYRERYAGLLHTAHETITDAAHAARAVERTFLALWKKRDTVETPADFEKLLEQLLHEAITNEHTRGTRVRMSVSRNGHEPAVGTAPSVDVSWEHVKAHLHATAVSPSELRALQNEARHHAAEHLKAVGNRRKPVRAIALGGLALIAIIGLLFVLPAMRRDAIGEALASPDTRAIFTKQGQRADVKLSDETAVKLGAKSEIGIPPHFTTQLRVVRLDGSASFTVAPHKLPFIVRAGRTTITATGTIFDVAAYPGDPSVVVRVREGSVKVRSGKNERKLTSPDAIVITGSAAPEAASAPVLNEALGWLDGQLVVADRPLRDVLPVIRRWYDLDLSVTDKSLLDRRITVQARLDSSQAAVRALLGSANLALEYQGKKAVLKDASTGPGRR